MNEYELTITVKVSTQDSQGINCSEFGPLLQEMLNDCDNGRHSFNTHLIRVGLQRELDAAVLELLEIKMAERYGKQRITDGRGRSRSRWSVEAHKKFVNAFKPHINWEPTVEIVKC